MPVACGLARAAAVKWQICTSVSWPAAGGDGSRQQNRRSRNRNGADALVGASPTRAYLPIHGNRSGEPRISAPAVGPRAALPRSDGWIRAGGAHSAVGSRAALPRPSGRHAGVARAQPPARGPASAYPRFRTTNTEIASTMATADTPSSTRNAVCAPSRVPA